MYMTAASDQHERVLVFSAVVVDTLPRSSIVILPSPFLLTVPNAFSARQRELHHHSRQVKKHSHSPICHLWRHGSFGDAFAHRTKPGEGSALGATHATPRPL
jgi:hypothetical protein